MAKAKVRYIRTEAEEICPRCRSKLRDGGDRHDQEIAARFEYTLYECGHCYLMVVVENETSRAYTEREVLLSFGWSPHNMDELLEMSEHPFPNN